ncbi:Hpt domain-containing protein, partial [Colwellia sp. BRX8-8]|nr:Hpt domain-containing protein [Colwellia sp. BRX8-8]
MSVDLTQFIPSFLEESFEGLELMESSLLNLEQGDDETINSIFRAAHSIKGGAGTFGFNHVTEFTHLVETLLDEMRDGRRNIEQDDVELLLESVDCMRLLIEAIRDEQECDSEKIAENSTRLEETLASSGNGNTEALLINVDDTTDNNNDITRWQIKFIPEHHLVQTGNDPLLLFNALADLGEISLVADAKDLPALSDIDAEELYLSWQLTL